MSGQVTLTLRDEVYRRAESLARSIGRPLAEVLADTIETSLGSSVPSADAAGSVADLSDEEVLAAADAMMAPRQNRRLTKLLDHQQARELTGAERCELAALMQVYGEGSIRKSQALAEAVRRGLREPLAP